MFNRAQWRLTGWALEGHAQHHQRVENLGRPVGPAGAGIEVADVVPDYGSRADSGPVTLSFPPTKKRLLPPDRRPRLPPASWNEPAGKEWRHEEATV